MQRLASPYYPSIAESARIALENLLVRVRLDADGSVASFVTDAPNAREGTVQIFMPSVDWAIRQSSFRRECAGREIELVYDFRLAPIDGPEGRISFQPPNRIEIFARHSVVQ